MAVFVCIIVLTWLLIDAFSNRNEVIGVERKYRLKKQQDFNRVYNRGKSFSNRELVVYYNYNKEIPKQRLGISVSKKVGNAVVRNRIRRIIKEVVRQLQRDNRLKSNIDIIIIARQPTAKMQYQDFKRSIIDLFYKSSIVIRNNK